MPNESPTIIFSKEKIQRAVFQVAQSVEGWLRENNWLELDLVLVLEGARPFAMALMELLEKRLPAIQIEKHEVRVRGTSATILLLEREMEGGLGVSGWTPGKPVLILDDLVDSGKTLALLKKRLQSLGADEIKTAVLIRKFGARSGPVDFCGFELNLDREAMALKGLKDYWLFGYGMDLNGQFRELDYVGWVEIHEEKAV